MFMVGVSIKNNCVAVNSQTQLDIAGLDIAGLVLELRLDCLRPSETAHALRMHP